MQQANRGHGGHLVMSAVDEQGGGAAWVDGARRRQRCVAFGDLAGRAADQPVASAGHRHVLQAEPGWRPGRIPRSVACAFTHATARLASATIPGTSVSGNSR